MRSPDEIAAEIEGLSPADLRVRALRQSGYIESLEQRLAAIAKALGVDLDDDRALRARPSREEAERTLSTLWIKSRSAAFATDGKNRRRADAIGAAMRDLGYGPEGER